MQVIGLKRQEWIFILQFELVIMHPEWNLIWILFRPQSFRLAFQMWQIGTLIFNIDAHTQKCGHWHIVRGIESRILVPVMIAKWWIEQFVQNNFCSRFIHIPRVFNVWWTVAIWYMLTIRLILVLIQFLSMHLICFFHVYFPIQIQWSGRCLQIYIVLVILLVGWT